MAQEDAISSETILLQELQEDGQSDIAADLQEAQEIKARFSDNAEVTRKYEALRLATIGALRDLRIETSEQLRAVQESITGDMDFSQLAEKGDISEDEKVRIQSLHTSLKSEVSGDILKSKDITDITATEAETLLQVSNAEYLNFISLDSTFDGMQASIWTLSVSSYAGIDSIQKMNVFQEALIEKILQTQGGSFEQGYTNQWTLVWFDSNKGNYTTTIDAFEAKVASGEELDRSTLSTYLLYKAEHSASPRAFMKEFSDTFGPRKERVQNLLAAWSDNIWVSKIMETLWRESYQIPVWPGVFSAFMDGQNFTDAAMDFIGTAQGYISTAVENMLSYLKSPDTQGDTSETLLPLLGNITQYISEVGDATLTGQLQTQVSWVFQDMLWDISDPNSFISRNLANTPLTRFEGGTQLYEVVLAAKTQEYERELRWKIDTLPVIQESRRDFLIRIQEETGLSESDAMVFFDKLVGYIEWNPGLIDSEEDLQEILAGRDMQSSQIAEILSEAHALAHQRQTEALELIVETFQILALDGTTTQESEQMIILLNTAKNLAEHIETLRTLPNGEVIAAYILGEMDEAGFRAQFAEPLPPTVWDVIQTTDTIPSPEVSSPQEVVDSLEAAMNPNLTQDERAEILTGAVEGAKLVADEAQVDVSTTILTTSAWLEGPAIAAVKETATQKVEEVIATSAAGQSAYIQDQVNELRSTLWEDNPLVVRITAAQEAGIQRAYENNTNTISGVVAPLPDIARNFYSGTIASLGLSETEVSTLTPSELKVITDSEMARENFINFRQVLWELNLQSIWQFRNQVFTAIGSLDFNIRDRDYIWENELNIFLSKVSYATLWKEQVPELKSHPSNIDETFRIIRRENNIWIFVGQEDFSAVGEGGWIIETRFREKFAPKDAGLLTFNTTAFQAALS